MTPLIKTYITGAPWRTILFFGPSFGLLMVFLLSRSERAYYGGNWYSELAIWSILGIVIGYSTWRSEGALERKNARWRAKRKRRNLK